MPSAVSSKIRQDPEQSSTSNPNQSLNESGAPEDKPPSLRSLLTPNVIIIFVNYGFLAFVDQCCSVLIPLVLATSIPYGGLGLSPFTIGFILSGLGVLLGLSSVIFFPPLTRKFGYRKIYRIAFACYSIVILTFPLMNYSAKLTGTVNAATWVLVVVCMVCTAFVTMAYCEFFWGEILTGLTEELTLYSRLYVRIFQ